MKLFPIIGATAAAALPAVPPSSGILYSSDNIGTPASSMWNSEQFSVTEGDHFPYSIFAFGATKYSPIVTTDRMEAFFASIETALTKRIAKSKKRVNASSIDSASRRRFFKVYPVPFVTAAAEFKRFASEEYREALKNVVEPYFRHMATIAVSDDVKVVQRAIRETFWPAVREALAGYDELRDLFEWTEFVNQKYYEHEENDPDAALVVTGNIDHALQVNETECCCLTLEDKAARAGMVSLPSATSSCSPGVAQAFSQIKAALGTIKATIPMYVPEEYVGLLQNGVEWIVLTHKLVHGVPYHRYCRATNVDDIVRALEHALCTAQLIVQQIRDPSQRPVRTMPTLHSIHEDDESGCGVGDDEEDEVDGNPSSSYPGHSKASKPHLSPHNSTAMNASKNGYTRSYEQHGGTEYYVLPLTESNLAAHFTAVKYDHSYVGK